MKKTFTLFAMMALFAVNMLFAQNQEKPILTFACLSDLHSQQTLISGDVETVRLRGTVKKTLNAIKAQENVDLVVLGGDFLSDVTIPERNYLKMRELLIEATRGVFPEGEPTPVIYVNGNHEYEVANFDAIPKKYNAGDYYTTPMKTDIGALDESDCFYETAENGDLGTVKLLSAYHYVIKGIDFVVLNTGKNFFGNAWNYVYSDESVQWCADKLAEIYADNKDKTVFFLVHLPFSDSNSISSASKGMTGTSAAMLKLVLSQYPNLIMLYGHDHGTNSAYIRANTAQRVTVYDTNGNLWTENDGEEASSMTFSVRNAASGEYLTYDVSSNLTTSPTPAIGTFAKSSFVSGTFSLTYQADVTRYVHSGSSGRFSGNESLSANSSLYVYRVDDKDAQSGTAQRVTEIEQGASYLFVTKSTAGGYYMLTNEPYGSGSGLRLVGVKVSSEVPADEITFTQSEKWSPVWTLDKDEPVSYLIKNYNTSEYLGFNSYNLANIDVPLCDVSITPSASEAGALNFTFSNSSKNNPYLYCGTSGRFSGNEDISNAASQILAFEVADPSAEKITATQVTAITPGRTYMLVCRKSGNYYALSNKMYKEGTSDQRMTGLAVRVSDGTISYTLGSSSVLWTIEQKENKPGSKSFFSSFMGSMRYYNNSIDNSSSVNDSRIVQALMVYVYSDRVELKMKNYGESGTINGITINKDLTPYVVNREVIHSAEAVTAAPAFSGETGGEVELGKSVKIVVDAPEWHNIYYTVDGTQPTTDSPKVVNGTIEWTPDSEGEFIVRIAAQEGIRLMSEAVDSKAYVVKSVSSAICNPVSTSGAIVSASKGAISVSNYTGTAKLYNVVGRLVGEATVSGNASFGVGKGVYILSLKSKAYKVVVK